MQLHQCLFAEAEGISVKYHVRGKMPSCLYLAYYYLSFKRFCQLMPDLQCNGMKSPAFSGDVAMQLTKTQVLCVHWGMTFTMHEYA